MNFWVVTGAVAMAIVSCYVFTWVVRVLAPRLGLVDRPDGQRKLQSNSIALGGGVAVYAALVATLLVFTIAATAEIYRDAWVAPLLTSGGLLCVAGLWDDKQPMRSWHKLMLQIAACLPFLAYGPSINAVSLFGFQVQLGWASTPLTLFWLVACVNAFNLIDGLDGLATTFGMIATATLGILAIMSGNHEMAILSLVACGSLVGFLFHNLPPARIYLGDAGSCCTGFLVGAVSTQTFHKTTAAYLMAVPMALLAIPFFDTLMAITRRKLSGRHIAAADREHIHHCLQDLGLSKRQALLALTCLTAVLSVAAVATSVLQNDWIAISTCAAMLSGLVACRIFGHREAAMLLSRLRVVAAFRWIPGPAPIVGQRTTTGETNNVASNPLIINLSNVEHSRIPRDQQHERRAA